MDRITPADPAWNTTFPHLLTPQEGESLTGLLLRCDEVNGWGCGETLSYLLASTSQTKLRRGVGQLTEIHLKKLARALSLPMAAVTATTYRAELVRLYGEINTEGKLSPVPFRMCPICIADGHHLDRTVCLPGINYCPHHQVLFVSRCQCGSELSPFTQVPAPFLCSCGVPWAHLPAVQTPHERLAKEQRVLTTYEVLLSKGTPDLLTRALQLLAQQRPALSHPVPEMLAHPLDIIVGELTDLDIPLTDLLI